MKKLEKADNLKCFQSTQWLYEIERRGDTVAPCRFMKVESDAEIDP